MVLTTSLYVGGIR